MKKAGIIFLLIILVLINSYGQSEEFLTDSSATRVLRGTLLIPASKKRMPLVLIIAGSGPTDRNGNGPMIKSDCYKVLADGLAKTASLLFGMINEESGKVRSPISVKSH
jgi:uncharacterized protein